MPDRRRVERTLNFVFGDHRTSQSREFFRVDPDKARAIIEMIAIEVERLDDRQQHITPEDRAAIETVKAPAELVTFERLGLDLGTVLTFTKDPTVTCTVVGARKVEFSGQELSLSAAALLAVREMGFDGTAIRGPEYWAFNDIKLSAMTPVIAEVV